MEIVDLVSECGSPSPDLGNRHPNGSPKTAESCDLIKAHQMGSDTVQITQNYPAIERALRGGEALAPHVFRKSMARDLNKSCQDLIGPLYHPPENSEHTRKMLSYVSIIGHLRVEDWMKVGPRVYACEWKGQRAEFPETSYEKLKYLQERYPFGQDLLDALHREESLARQLLKDHYHKRIHETTECMISSQCTLPVG